jgi:serralysin
MDVARYNGWLLLDDNRSDRLGDPVILSKTAALAGSTPRLLEDNTGGTFRTKLIADHDRVIQQIDSGARLDTSDNVITYAFSDFQHALGLNNNPGFGEGKGYSPMSAAERDAAREGLTLWDDLIPLTIKEVTPGPGASTWGKNTVDIWFANTTTGPAQAWAYYPGGGHQYKRVSSDVWTADPTVNGSNANLDFGGYGATTLIHESGHALGLSHPGAYNFGPGFSVNYVNGAEYAQDSLQYSIMSYWGAEETLGSLGSRPNGLAFLDSVVVVDWLTQQANNPQTPLIHDILTIQDIYGADLTTRAGDTVYGYGSNAGKDVYNFDLNPFPYLAIYDAGGNDTISMSGTKAGVFIDLRPGAFSSAAEHFPTAAESNAARAAYFEPYGVTPAIRTDARMHQLENAYVPRYEQLVADATGVHGIMATSYANISIAYNTIIENAIGGSARDYLVGNDVANRLEGRDGDDVLNGLGGNDLLMGGAGADTFAFSGNAGKDTIADFKSGSDRIDLSAYTGVHDVGFSADHHQVFVDTNNDHTFDMTIVVNGDAVQATDIIFG